MSCDINGANCEKHMRYRISIVDRDGFPVEMWDACYPCMVKVKATANGVGRT